jgi:hypothetical protein
MRGIVHPFSKALYEQDGNGNIRVTHKDRDGGRDRAGIFGIDGRWISGELKECDPQLCGWVGGPQIANHRVATMPKDSREELDTPLSD